MTMTAYDARIEGQKTATSGQPSESIPVGEDERREAIESLREYLAILQEWADQEPIDE